MACLSNLYIVSRFCIVCLFISSSILSYSQSKYLAFKSGVNISSVSQNTAQYEVTGLRFGYHLGVGTNIKLNNFWVIQPEIVYSNQGYTARDGSYRLRYNYDYLNVPFLIKLNRNKFSLHSGVQIGFLLKASRYYVDADKYEKVLGLSRIEASIESGMGYMFFGNFGIDVRLNAGVLKLDGGESFYNIVGQFSVLYVISK
jgi:hypothetical protein